MKLLQYLKETKSELKEVTFPTFSTTTMFAMLVIVISVAVALMLSGIDLGLRELLAKVIAR
jgi:preprotein translocase SecE subunit